MSLTTPKPYLIGIKHRERAMGRSATPGDGFILEAAGGTRVIGAIDNSTLVPLGGFLTSSSTRCGHGGPAYR